MTQKQHEFLRHVKEQLAGQNGLENSTQFNTTNPFYTGTSDIPAENVTLPLDHFGGNSGKPAISRRWRAILPVNVPPHLTCR